MRNKYTAITLIKFEINLKMYVRAAGYIDHMHTYLGKKFSYRVACN